LALCLGWWSAANIATGLVRGITSLGFVRTLLGLGESGLYTAAPKAIGEHFEPERRGFAYGFFTAGAMIGATLAPPLIGGLAITYGWRAAFVVTGAAGFVLVAAWLAIYRRPGLVFLSLLAPEISRRCQGHEPARNRTARLAGLSRLRHRQHRGWMVLGSADPSRHDPRAQQDDRDDPRGRTGPVRHVHRRWRRDRSDAGARGVGCI